MSESSNATRVASAAQATPKVTASDEAGICLEVKNLNLFYAESQALDNICMPIPEKQVTAFIGPSGCGKSTLLRCFNRMNGLPETQSISQEYL